MEFMFGSSFPEDFTSARQYLEKALLEDSVVAMNNLGEMYRLGQGVQKDIARALALYEQGDNLGCVICGYNIGEIYRDGEGVEVDLAKAYRWFARSAERGSSHALFQLAVFQENHWTTVKHSSTVNEIYREAADQGSSEAQFAIGKFFYEQKDKDTMNTGLKYLVMAAEDGSDDAAAYLKNKHIH